MPKIKWMCYVLFILLLLNSNTVKACTLWAANGEVVEGGFPRDARM